MIILGIESSCDETGLAIYDSKNNKLLANCLFSQIDLHKDYGGVVPELASRDHIRRIKPLLDEVLLKSSINIDAIGAIAYTAGPGLVGALMVGSAFAKSLAFSLGIPSIKVHHMEGHLMSVLLSKETINTPFIALLISGGHTQLVRVDRWGEYKVIGESIDDAAGEAFDKTAKMMGLPYPGGPNIAKIALDGIEDRYKFTKPMVDRPGLDFSFSGLKTAALNSFRSIQNPSYQDKADIALAFENTIIDTIAIKCKRALLQENYKNLVIAGGVSANIKLRSILDSLSQKHGINVYYPPLKYCTDNGAMIAIAGAHKINNNVSEINNKIDVFPRVSIEGF